MPTLSGLADVVGSLATPGTVVLERASGVTTNAEGGAVRAAPITKVMPPTVVHPISGRDRALLPEGIRNRETIVTYATERLRTSQEFGDLADVLIHRPFDGNESRYVVTVAENWGHVSGHWRVFSSREPAA